MAAIYRQPTQPFVVEFRGRLLETSTPAPLPTRARLKSNNSQPSKNQYAKSTFYISSVSRNAYTAPEDASRDDWSRPSTDNRLQTYIGKDRTMQDGKEVWIDNPRGKLSHKPHRIVAVGCFGGRMLGFELVRPGLDSGEPWCYFILRRS